MIIAYLIICLAIAASDIKYRVIPDKLIILGLVFSLTFYCYIHHPMISIIGMLAGGLSMLLAGSLCFLISEKPALGGGDLKLLMMIGSFWGWKIALMTFAIAPILGSFWASILNKTKLAYGVFLIVSSIISLLFWRYYGYQS